MNRQEFFKKVHATFAVKEIPCLVKAYWFAKNVHRNQKRDGGERYFEHCRRVACFLIDHGETSAEEITIALIHDCVEDGFIPDGIIQSLFGEEVANAVAILSKVTTVSGKSTGVVQKKRKSDEEYFRGIRDASTMIRRIKLADRLDNIKSMQEWDKERRQKYIIETETYILPIARTTDKELLKELEDALLKQLSEPFEYTENCIKCGKSVVQFRVWTENKFFEFSKLDCSVSAPMEKIFELRAALERHDLEKVDELVGQCTKGEGLFGKYFCNRGNHFYCEDCNDVEMVSDGFSTDFYDHCPCAVNDERSQTKWRRGKRG